MIVHVLKHVFVVIANLGDFPLKLIGEPVVSLDNFSSVKIGNLLIDNTVFLFSRELSKDSLNLLNVSLDLSVSLLCNPGSTFHELSSFLVS
jgi:hypothetical protein